MLEDHRPELAEKDWRTIIARTVNHWQNNFTKTHLIVFACLLVIFSILTYLIGDARIDQGPEHDAQVLETTLATISGPLVGAVSRKF
jgi:hypothetical protein